jgi:hypothetical protein
MTYWWRAPERRLLVCSKIVEMEEELRVVGNNLKSLELSEEKALAREDTFQLQIRELDARLKEVGGGGRSFLRAGPFSRPQLCPDLCPAMPSSLGRFN